MGASYGIAMDGFERVIVSTFMKFINENKLRIQREKPIKFESIYEDGEGNILAKVIPGSGFTATEYFIARSP